MSIVASIRRQVVPVHPEGYVFIAAFAVATLVLQWLWSPLGWVAGIMTAWCVYFFRDPARITPMREGLVVSPADGVISSIGFFVPPPELGLGDRPLQRVSVFMSVFDCHVNRAPMSGRITKMSYRAGTFVNADLDKASDDNERAGLVIDTASGRIGVVQIAGLLARRIVSFTREGETLGVGDRFGLIRFGSRVDVFLPEGVRVLVGQGSKAIAGETVLADIRASEPARSFKAG
ncbi:phosphatidylserine decarboxylase [Lichenihabitans sp. Uapishka_5]|uniref:phosphatidylserine decarboxylase n=1 Tax=Lichenihabitans sp. Uapishka_5 TaxID=3037302 RepID=UPI0029E7E8AC|nr:phosphatidylserine decarboxylase [Lichenihabitans sp. Uapishka_5]MDX7951121.1 phosphatidylserine decarboxylase [Lichenihabitans sp. Uapishka_5]